MRLCYQVATPDVKIDESVTAYQGPLEKSFKDLSDLGYDGVELMTLNPKELDWEELKNLLDKYHLEAALVCTGEIFGQLKLSYTDPDEDIRKEAIRRTKEIIDFAGYLKADINIGRIRGQYNRTLSKKQTWNFAVDAFKEISIYAKKTNVRIALETVTIMQTNFINTLEEGLQMVMDVNEDNFRLMMDVFHLNLEEKNIYDAIRKYQDYNIHVHLADNNRRYPGQCGLDFDKIIRTFKECGYEGTYSTEIFQIPNQKVAAEESIRYLKPILNSIYQN